MLKIPYYVQQRITKRIIDVIMIILLIITLFPIVWMVFSSFKSNTEILLGQIPFGRAGNDVIYMESRGKNLFAMTADGGISKFDTDSKNLIAYDSLKSMATSFIMDAGYVWAATSDKGLVRISIDDFSKQTFFDPKIKDLDINKVAATNLILEKNSVWVSWQQKNTEYLMRFNKDLMTFSDKIDLTCALSPFQITSMTTIGNVMWIGTTRGLISYDLSKKSILKSYNTSDINLPYTSISKLVAYKEDLYLSTTDGLFQFSPKSGKIVNSFTSDNGLSSSRVSYVMPYNDKIIAGTNNSLSIVDFRTKKVVNYDKLFVPVANSKAKGLVYGDVFYITKAPKGIFIGSSGGRVSALDGTFVVKESLKVKDGHIMVRWRNYIDLWKNINFGLYLKNSLIICGITMILAMIFATTAAYSLARFNFPGNQFFSVGVLATQMIPAIMYLIPIYIMFTQFTNWTGIPVKGTHVGLIMIYSAFFIPFSIWILRGFFASIPAELEEAGRIDGCSQFQVFWYIVLPLAIPGIIATGAYVFLTAWDELMFAWVLCNADTMTIPVGIRLFVGNYQNRFDLMMAAATVATIPVMVLFFMLQKYIVKGLTAGAVKG